MTVEAKITKLFQEAEVTLLTDLQDYGIVGNGFWGILLKQTLEIVHSSEETQEGV